jgi:hypothetical protein
MVESRVWCRWGAVAAVVFAASCSSPVRPPSRPATRIYDRSMAQLGVIDLVVSDRARAERAEALLEQVEQAFVTAETLRRKAAETALGLSDAGEPTDEEIRSSFRTMDEAASRAFQRYVAVQLELRQVLTRREFEKLKEVR